MSEKQNNKVSAAGARLPKEAMQLRGIFKFTKPSLEGFCPFGLISRVCQGPRNPRNSTHKGRYCMSDNSLSTAALQSAANFKHHITGALKQKDFYIFFKHLGWLLRLTL